MGQIVRLLLIIISVWLAVWLIRRAFFAAPSAKPPSDRQFPPQMLPCAYCGVHVPEDHALMQAGKAYCSKEHVPTRSTE